MKLFSIFLLSILLITQSLAALRRIYYKDLTIIPDAAFYTIHKKEYCEKRYTQHLAYPCVKAITLPKENNSCRDHDLIKDILAKLEDPIAYVITYQNKDRQTLAYVEVPHMNLREPAKRLDPSVILQPVRAAIKDNYICFYDDANEPILLTIYFGSDRFNLEDRTAFDYLDFSKFQETHVYL